MAIADSLAIFGWPVRDAFLEGSPFHTELGNRFFDLEYFIGQRVPPTRWCARMALTALGGGRMARSLKVAKADLLVPVFPAASEVVGELRKRGHIDVPIVSGITDLAALRYWAHPGCDLHLLIHPESEPEVRAIAGPASRPCGG